MKVDINSINESVKKESAFLKKITDEMEKVIVGQKYLIERLMVGILANGHVLIESVPGLAKTLSVNTLSRLINAKFHRLQFTPDLLPADLLGTLIYNPKTGDFTIKKGPLFANIILADEINRAPSKVQSALLEAMQEKQITIGDNTFKLEEPFLVFATQNPIEQEGTYPLSEAQVDRFMLKINITYPTPAEELGILERMAFTDKKIEVNAVINPQDIVRVRSVVDSVYIDDKIKKYVVDIVTETRKPNPLIRYGASPRATINLTLAAKAYAFIQGRGYVLPQDIKDIGMDVLRHRILVSYEARAQEKTSEDIVKKIFEEVKVP